MENEIKVYDPRQWLSVTAATPKELILLKESGTLPKTGARTLIKTNQTEVQTELMEMITRVAILTGSENIRSRIVVDELINVFMSDNELYHLTLADIFFAFRKGAGGLYGKHYGKVTFTHLVEWLREYEVERATAIEERHRAGKHDDISARTSGKVKDLINGMRNK